MIQLRHMHIQFNIQYLSTRAFQVRIAKSYSVTDIFKNSNMYYSQILIPICEIWYCQLEIPNGKNLVPKIVNCVCPNGKMHLFKF